MRALDGLAHLALVGLFFLLGLQLISIGWDWWAGVCLAAGALSILEMVYNFTVSTP